ncbi:MAG: ArnT family glycosyltransferase [Patescibacteria group bacterium]
MSKKIIIEYFLLSIIFVFAFILRLYKINIPLADHHSWRQADTAAVARNFVKEGWDFLRPRIDNMTFLHSPDKPNKERLFLVEPPIYQTIVAGVYKVFGIKESMARLVSIAFFLGSMIFLYLLARQYFGSGISLLSAFFFAILPYSIFYSRVILPEPMMIFLTMGLIYFLIKWLDKEKIIWWAIAVLFASLALTQKIFPPFLVLPLAYLVLRKYSLNAFRQPKIWLLVTLSLLPIVAWRVWISQFPEGIPPSDWLLNQGAIRFKGAFFWWIFAERLGKLILGHWGLIPFGLGLILIPGKKEGWFFHLWLLSTLIYVTIFAAGNVTHDYYQIPFIPITAIFLAKGSYWLLTAPRQIFNKAFCFLLSAFCFLFMLAFSWYQVRDFYNIQGGVDLAGQAVDKLTPKETLVLTGDSNDATLLYNTNRHGWTGGYASYFPNTQETIEKIKKMGGSVYVTTKFEENSEFGKYMLQSYPVLKRTDQYIIFSLY